MTTKHRIVVYENGRDKAPVSYTDVHSINMSEDGKKIIFMVGDVGYAYYDAPYDYKWVTV